MEFFLALIINLMCFFSGMYCSVIARDAYIDGRDRTALLFVALAIINIFIAALPIKG